MRDRRGGRELRQTLEEPKVNDSRKKFEVKEAEPILFAEVWTNAE